MSRLSQPSFVSICPVCQMQIDVTALEPFAKVACPSCHQLVRVRRNFDHFRINRELGQGGMSRVFEAEDETLGRRVALKILNKHFSRDQTRVEQFKREAQLTARLSHPNVIKLFSTGEDQGYFYLAMELVGGGSLEQKVDDLGRMPELEAVQVFIQVAEGLRAAQRAGLIHRDVKPANILFTEVGTVKVVDFGLAIFSDSGGDESGEIWATPYYVAPEKVLHNQEDHRSDIFSLGAALYYALIGKPPHDANTSSLAELRVIKSKPVQIGDTGVALSAQTELMVDRMLALDPDQRPLDYDVVIEGLRLAERQLLRGNRLPGTPRQRMLAGTMVAVLAAYALGWWGRSTGEKVVTANKLATTLDVGIDNQTVEVRAGRTTVGERFRTARDALLAGDHEQASELFAKLLQENLRQPTLGWAHYHSAVCAILQRNAEQLRADLSAMAKFANIEDSSSQAETVVFFRKLARDLSSDTRQPVDKILRTYSMDNEQCLGLLLHGLHAWYQQDTERGAELLRSFFARIPAMRNMLTITSTEWVVRYAETFEQRYRTELEVWDSLRNLNPPADALEAHATLAQLSALEKNLAENSSVFQNLRALRRACERLLARERLLLQEKELEIARERRLRELVQFEELNDLLPRLIQHFDYSKAIEVLEAMDFETMEVEKAVETKLYALREARSFIQRLADDLQREPWSGRLRKVDGSLLEGRILQLKPPSLTVEMTRGAITTDVQSLGAEALITMALAYANRETDASVYYARMESIAVFAKINGLESIASMVAAPLTEENRGFRERWVRML